MTVPGLFNTWRRGQADERGFVTAATVPSDFAYDGRLMTQAEFLIYVKETDFAWATRGAVVHHTANPTEATWRNYGGWSYWGPQMASYYRRTLGWKSGPHAFISYEGIGVFTPMNVKGIHAGSSANSNTIGMETVGNFTSTLPSGATLDNAVWAFACVLWKLGKTGKDDMYPHRYFGSTACPGAKWYANFSWFEGLVDAKIAEIKLAEEGEPDPPPSTHEQRIAALELATASLIAAQATTEQRLMALEAWQQAHEGDGK